MTHPREKAVRQKNEVHLVTLPLFLLQFAYYVMREEDKRRKWPDGVSRQRALGFLTLIEIVLLTTAYIIIARVTLGHRIAKPPLPSFVSPVIVAFAVAFFVGYFNVLLLGGETRIRHYRKIFDSWDKRRRFWWNVLLNLIAGASLVAFLIVGEIAQNGFDIQDWKW